ncbi:MAG: mobile mystery protein B [Gammaproteobacteria bacterium]
MISLLDKPEAGETPLTPEEREELIPSYITDRAALNDAEQINIISAESWAYRRRRDVLERHFLCDLHRRMFGQVWGWAGCFRTTERNIGVDPSQIAESLEVLLADARFWVENGTYSIDESAVRFHHRLVWIHPFPNGNGRFSRLITDLLLMSNGCEPFTWGSRRDAVPLQIRADYISALRKADHQNYRPLIAFVRS